MTVVKVTVVIFLTLVIVTVTTVSVGTVVIATYFRKKHLDTSTTDEIFSGKLFAILAMFIITWKIIYKWISANNSKIQLSCVLSVSSVVVERHIFACSFGREDSLKEGQTNILMYLFSFSAP